jgi:hypothetical protein
MLKVVVQYEKMLHILALHCAFRVPPHQLATSSRSLYLQWDDTLKLLVPPDHRGQPLVVSQDDNLLGPEKAPTAGFPIDPPPKLFGRLDRADEAGRIGVADWAKEIA